MELPTIRTPALDSATNTKYVFVAYRKLTTEETLMLVLQIRRQRKRKACSKRGDAIEVFTSIGANE